MELITKDKDANLDYGFDWSAWLPQLPTPDIIVGSQWILPADLTLTGESFDDTTTTVWISGGLVNQTYTITNRITTNDGRIDDRSFLMRMTER